MSSFNTLAWAALLIGAVALAAIAPVAAAETDSLIGFEITPDRIGIARSPEAAKAIRDRPSEAGLVILCRDVQFQASAGGRPHGSLRCSEAKFSFASRGICGHCQSLTFVPSTHQLVLEGTAEKPVTLDHERTDDTGATRVSRVIAERVWFDVKERRVRLEGATSVETELSVPE
ncbi:MAG TPA: hypothetical protein VMY37_05975 [Thermoguttaceae bacterium]|nr:hypothetical protein [Thermoguttaceae bacterium]